MHRHLTARAASISTVILALTLLVGPAAVAHDDADDQRGHSDPAITIEVGCDSVEVTSSKKLSTVTVYFLDGTEETIEMDEREYSSTFEEVIDRAVAESHGTTAEDASEDCSTEPEPSDDAETGDGHTDDDVDKTDDDGATTRRTSTRSAGGGGGTTTTSTTSTQTTATTMTAPAVPTQTTGGGVIGGMSLAGNVRVLGLAIAEGVKSCPSGPFKGMPYMNIKDCGDAVLAGSLAATGRNELLPLTGVGLGLVALGALMLLVRRNAPRGT